MAAALPKGDEPSASSGRYSEGEIEIEAEACADELRRGRQKPIFNQGTERGGIQIIQFSPRIKPPLFTGEVAQRSCDGGVLSASSSSAQNGGSPYSIREPLTSSLFTVIRSEKSE